MNLALSMSLWEVRPSPIKMTTLLISEFSTIFFNDPSTSAIGISSETSIFELIAFSDHKTNGY